MDLAGEEIRDGIAEWLGGFFGGLFGWLVDALLWVVGSAGHAGLTVGGLFAAFLLWRLSLALGPTKICWRCGGDGHVGGLLGGRRDCRWCNASGRRPRVGSK